MTDNLTLDAANYLEGFEVDMESRAAAAALGFALSGKTNPEELTKEEAISFLKEYDGDWDDLPEPSDDIYCYYLDI